jgi:hypothetical protein
MTKRRRLVLVSAAAVVLSGMLALPGVHWRLYGWAKGEAFFRGRPTSYYRPFCHKDYFLPTGMVTIDPYEGGWVQRLLGRWLTHRLFDKYNPLDDCDSASVPVLVELLRDPDWEVRFWAVCYLEGVRPPARDALPALRQLLSEWDDRFNRAVAEDLIQAIELSSHLGQ